MNESLPAVIVESYQTAEWGHTFLTVIPLRSEVCPPMEWPGNVPDNVQ